MSREKIVQAIKTLYRSGDVVEVRAFNAQSKYVGRFRYGQALANALLFADEQLQAEVYLCLNPTLLGTTIGLQTGIEGAKEPDIAQRRWFLLDGDSVRDFIRDAEGQPTQFPLLRRGLPVLDAEGKPRFETRRHKIATQAEWQATYEVMNRARLWLIGRGCAPEAVVIASSGNGVHLLCRCDLPNDDAAKRLIATVQRAISMQFSTDIVEIECFADGDRLVRAYGTTNKKGSETTERKYRESGLL